MTQPIGGIDEIITHIYHGPLEPNPWQTFLRHLRLRTDSDIAAIMLRPAKPGASSLTLWDMPMPPDAGTIDRATFEHARVGYLDPLTNALGGRGDVRTIDEVVPLETLHASEFYQQLMLPYGIEHMLAMCFAESNGWKCFVGILNGPHKANFGAAEKDLFRAFCPHLERALNMYALLKRNELEKEIYEEALDRLTIGAVILDGNIRVIRANQVARNILESSSCLSLVDGTIVFVKSKHAAAFNQLVRDALAWRDSGNPDSFVDVLRIDAPGESSLGLLVRTAPVAQWYQSDAGPNVILYLGDLQQHQQAPEQFIGRLFGLTPSEATLATLLADGLTLSEAAQRMNLTEGSVRTCSKRIYAKTGVNRQAGLVRLVLKSVALLGATGKPESNKKKRR